MQLKIRILTMLSGPAVLHGHQCLHLYTLLRTRHRSSRVTGRFVPTDISSHLKMLCAHSSHPVRAQINRQTTNRNAGETAESNVRYDAKINKISIQFR